MLKQSLGLKLFQKLSPQQIQLMNLIQLPLQEFEQRVNEELDENPALELGLQKDSQKEDDLDFDSDFAEEDINIDEYLNDDETPDYKTHINNYSDDDDDRELPVEEHLSFHQELINQLNTFVLEDYQREIAEFLIGNIDDSGYIRRNIDDIVDDLAFTQGIYTEKTVVEKMLHIIHQLEPAGIGARNLQECLLLQLKNKTPSEEINLARDIIEKNFDSFSKKQYDKLFQKYTVSTEQLKKSFREIEKLNPKPGSSFIENNKITENIVPDFIIRIVENKLELTLNGRNSPSLHISKDYQEMMQEYKKSINKSEEQRDAVQFIKQKLDTAKWFIDAIHQRQETLYVTMSAIMNYQEEFFLEGDQTKIKPMILKDIADSVGLDISTISRVANSKYVATPYGTKLIKDFFSESMKNEQGEDISTLEIKKHLQNIIETEDKQKPLNDEQLVELLQKKGFLIARRTIAKYRDLLGIPVARMRKLF